MDRNLKVSVFEVYREHAVLFPDRPQHIRYSLHLELRQRDKAIDSQQIDDRPPGTTGCRTLDWASPQVPELPSGASWRPPSEVTEHKPTPGSKTEAPEAPATQVGSDGTTPCSHPEVPLQSNLRRRRTARHTKANRERLLPAAMKEARNLQNFFPFRQREEKEEALKDDDTEEEDRKNALEEEPKSCLDCCCCGRCCWRDCCEKCSFLPFC